MLLACGCTPLKQYIHNGFKVGPNYARPGAPVAPEWIDPPSNQVRPESADLGHWWDAFNDPLLSKLIDDAYRQNLDLQRAGARILEARAERNIAVGRLFPQQQDATGAYKHVQISRNTAFVPPIAVYDDWSTGMNLTWEIDFWGRFRRNVEAANAELDATVENYDDVLVILLADVAAAYVQMRTFEERIRYATENLTIQKDLTDKAEQRFKQGAVSKLDLAQMRSNLEDTQSLIYGLQIGMRQANNRLCILLGIPPRDLAKEFEQKPIPAPPATVCIGIPADLIRRRPDIRRSERQVAAQSARIGIADAELYPHFAINGTLGYQSQELSNLMFQSKSFTGSIGPSFRWDILNYGRLINRVRVEDARFQGEVYNYQSTVLRAGREVEDSLVAFVKAQMQVQSLTASARDAEDAVEVVLDQNKALQFDVNRAFVTTNFLTGQKDKLAQARGNVALSLIMLYKSLGGGWEIRLPDSCPPPPTHPAPLATPDHFLPPREPELLPAPRRDVMLGGPIEGDVRAMKTP